MNFAFCFDRNYSQHAIVAMYSLCDNLPNEIPCTIYLITDFSDSELFDLIRTALEKSNIKFKWIDTGKIDHLSMPVKDGSHFSKAIYYRLLLPQLLPDDVTKIIYLDSDLVCVRDMTEINQIMPDVTCAVAGVLDNDSEVQAQRLGLEKYINSGVLILNLDIWRKNQIAERCFEWLSNNHEVTLGDQDAINVVCKDSMMMIERKWNTCISLEHILIDEDTKVFHYYTHNKPWHAWYNDDLGAPYDYYLAQTPFKNAVKQSPKNVNECCEFARKLIAKNRASEASKVYEQVISELLTMLNKQS